MSSWVSPFPISMLTSQTLTTLPSPPVMWESQSPASLSLQFLSGSLCPTFTDTCCKDILVVILNLWSHLTYKFILNPDINFNFLKISLSFLYFRNIRHTLLVPNIAILPTQAIPPSNPSRNSSMKYALPSLTSINLTFIYSL